MKVAERLRCESSFVEGDRNSVKASGRRQVEAVDIPSVMNRLSTTLNSQPLRPHRPPTTLFFCSLTKVPRISTQPEVPLVELVVKESPSGRKKTAINNTGVVPQSNGVRRTHLVVLC